MPNNNISNLKLGHLNVRGLETHIDDIKLLLHKTEYHFFAVTETKLKSSAPVGPVRVPAYNLVKHSLPSNRGRGSKCCGGIGIYVVKGLKAIPVLKSTFDPSVPLAYRFEYLVVQVKVNDINIGIATVYNPNVANPYFAREYEKLLLDIQDLAFERLFVVGDFNINVKAPQPSANLEALNRIHDAFHLTILPTPPTRIAERSATTIDLLITDCPDSIRAAKTKASSFSDHEIVLLISDFRIRKAPPQRIKVRNFRNVDAVALQADFQTIDFRRALNTDDIDIKTELITTELLNLMHQHAPERIITVRDKRTPWITAEIQRAIAHRDLAHALYSRNPNRRRNDNQWNDYVRKRNKAASLISAAKKRYGEMHFGHDLPAKKLWSNLRREGVHNNAKKNVPTDQADPEEMNRFFCDGHRLLATGINGGAAEEPTHRTATDRGEMFIFRHTTAIEVSRKIMEVQTNATGSDGVPISFIKMLVPFVLPLLVHLFNAIIDARTFPAIWKKALITPVPKVSNPTTPKDFRPISVLPAISKVLEKILLDQIVLHVDVNDRDFLAPNQSGYRKRYSTTTALAKVTHDIYGHFDNNQCTVMVLVDFSLAFNSVDHRKLQRKLREEFLFSDDACGLLSSFLGNRSQAVKIGDTVSSQRPMTDGTPQGSCLSALLFSLYINSLPRELRCSYQLYADDLQIYLSGSITNVDQLIATINEDLESIQRWARQNSLFPNPKKTQAIVFCKEGSVTPTSEITFCGEHIPLTDYVVNLGLRMDRNMKWKQQVNDVTAKVFGTLRTFRRFAPVLSTQTRKKLVQSVIIPFFTYCDVIYFPGLSAVLREQLNRGFKAAVRFVYGLRRRESTAEVRNTILGHDLDTNYRNRINCFIRQGYSGTLPGYLQQHLRRGQLVRARAFVIPHHTTTEKKSVLITGPLYWNQLPLITRQQPTIDGFKAALSAI